jgi:hypothetical protein
MYGLVHPRRKVFISYYQKDINEVNTFIFKFATQGGIFIPKAIGVSNNDNLINSTNTEYVMNRIREKYLGDSTVTIVLIGSCTHSRRFVDWEIKSSLRQGSYIPNGLMGIILPSLGDRAHLPPRFKFNWDKDHEDCYARYYVYPKSPSILEEWIEDAFHARETRAHLIKNSSDMMKYNAKCLVHGVTH